MTTLKRFLVLSGLCAVLAQPGAALAQQPGGGEAPPPKVTVVTLQARDVTLTASLTDTVRGWRDHLPGTIALPHPSWRNTAWLKRNPWFETDLLPDLRRRVDEVMDDG